MISDRIKNKLELSFKIEVIESACEKLQKKIDDGTFNDPHNEGKVEAYLRAICENNKKAPIDKAQSYKLYRAENIFTELVKENGKNWFSETVAKIHELPDETFENLKQEARNHWWYSKKMMEGGENLTDEEHELLKTMFYDGKRKESALNDKERAVSDKVIEHQNKLRQNATLEAMAVVYEMRYKNKKVILNIDPVGK